MPKLTRRESALAFMSQAPLDMDVPEPPKARAKSTHPEAQIHAACAKWLRIRQKRGDLRFHSTLVEGQRNSKRAGWFKMMAGSPGFPDIIVMQHDPVLNRRKVVFIELKAPGGTLSDAQVDWATWLRACGWEHHVIRSVDVLAALFP